MIKEEKHKAIAIPVSFADDRLPRFLTVKDRRFKEWIFVTGGCRKREVSNPLRTALRELEEETRGVVNIKRGTYSYFKFYNENRTLDELRRDRLQGIKVIYVYHVFILDFNVNKTEQLNLIKRFNDEKQKTDNRKRAGLPIRRTYDENDLMNFETLSEFKARDRVWEVIRTNILNNPEFTKCICTPNRHSFNIKTY
jgi:8-oxo-dGTP pyrophosphatase MutT (NUDIX family)